MVQHHFWISQIFLTTLLIHTTPNDFYPESSKKDCCIAVVYLLINPKQKLSKPSMHWEFIATCRFQLILCMGWSSSQFLQYNNLSDIDSDKPGAECYIRIHYLITSKTVDQHNTASWCRQQITCSNVSLSIRHLCHFEWLCYLQSYSHLPTTYIPHDHFDIHRLCHIGRLFDACWNTDMSMSTLEMFLLCDEQYFKLRCLDIIFLIDLEKCEMIVYVMLWYYIVVGCIYPYFELWGWCVAP